METIYVSEKAYRAITERWLHDAWESQLYSVYEYARRLMYFYRICFDRR